MDTTIKTYTRKEFLTAGQCDAEGKMPLPLIAERLIEAATDHANALGIGYATLAPLGIGWVLNRLSIEMMQYPGINEEYAITTWIETLNRRFSERNFMITGKDGSIYGYARSVWSAIDFERRCGADLSALDVEKYPHGDLDCPIEKAPRISALDADAVEIDYTFRYTDLDFNRHVNTVRYVELLMDQWQLERYDCEQISRFDLLFHQECLFGENVVIRNSENDNGISDCEILRDGQRVLAARFQWVKRQAATVC